MKYKIFEIQKESVYVNGVQMDSGTYKFVEPKPMWVANEHDTIESAKEEMEKSKKDLGFGEYVILPVISIGFNIDKDDYELR